MRSVISFFSLLAFGVLAIGVLAVVASGHNELPTLHGLSAGALDLTSLLVGFALGILLSALARVSWRELPSRTLHWLLHYERSFYRVMWAVLLVGFLIYY